MRGAVPELGARIQTETIPVQAALGRVLPRDQYARVTIPVARASAMDGIAVCAARFGQGAPDTAGWKLGEDFCRADTGDDFDDRFDAVCPAGESLEVTLLRGLEDF